MGTIRLYPGLRLNAVRDAATRAALKEIDDFLRSLYDGGPATATEIDAIDGRIDTLEARAYLAGLAIKSSDQSITGVGYGADEDVANLSFSVEAGVVYAFEFNVLLTTGSDTLGPRLAVNGPAAPTALSYAFSYPANNGITGQTVLYSSVVTAYDTGDATTAGPGTGGGPARLFGRITPSAAGTLILRANRESAGDAFTIKAGSWGALYRNA